MTNLKPLNDRVVVKPNKPEEVSKGGIVLIPDKEKTTEGTVVAVGPGRILDNGTRVRPEIEVGQIVVFPLYMGTEIDIEGVAHRVMSEQEILAVYGPKA